MLNIQSLSFMRKQPYFEILCALYSFYSMWQGHDPLFFLFLFFRKQFYLSFCSFKKYLLTNQYALNTGNRRVIVGVVPGPPSPLNLSAPIACKGG